MTNQTERAADAELAREVAQLAADGRGLWLIGILAIVAGILTGLVGAAFRRVLELAAGLRLELSAWSFDRGWAGLGVAMLVVAACAAAARALVRYAPEAGGSGVQRVEAVMRGEVEPARLRVLPVKFVGGALALGSGLVLGREGPTVQMGATIGAWLAHRLRLADADIRDLEAAAAGAGLGVAFGAPLGGTLFVFEEVRRSFTLRLSVATLLACMAASATAWSLLGGSADFTVRPPAAMDLPSLLPVLVLGAVLGALGVAYNRFTVLMCDLAERAPRIPPEAKAALIGALLGALLWWEPRLVGGGDGLSQAMLSGQATLLSAAVILAARWALGPLCFAAGAPGGVFAPLLVIGAAGGVLFAHLANLLGGLALDPVALAIVGMSTFFVGVVRAPLTGIVLIVEMTAVTTQVIPMLAAAGTAMIVASVLRGLPVYDTLRLRMLRRAR